MYNLVHRYAPESPAGRTAVAVVSSLIGVPVLILARIGYGSNLSTLTFLLAGLALLAVAWCLTLGVVRQANAAPDATPFTEPQTDEVSESSTETPVETLRRRYAEGELSDDAFQRRLDNLLETESLGRDETEPERVFE
ncbi:hypothetical protein BM92_07935 [Haloferax mediterranei ATCC 33500]|uniref:SHOCT domain-containing protein n=1 Tax=Haloferax mediterranei (strain ATCC 33500 / DSM 1411 / JCM 8866 / NBRC 14739 / NCIMB 2177 / R-4) TaxID=523841 RepID=A0A059TUV4_HALMT|nr:hypothetical protein BM92_07935 [Haloferax mediterranei ATCC 33500]